MKIDKLTIAHISDLHRSSDNPISNEALLTSLIRDIDTYSTEGIHKPDILIVSGDIVQGSNNYEKAATLLSEQYTEALEFLNSLADVLFDGDKSKIILVPGNHDISWTESKNSMERIEEKDITEHDGILRKNIFQEAIKIDSNIKWSWSDRSFYRIINSEMYENRFAYFCDFYQKFYNGEKSYSLDPNEQFDIFDFQEWGVSIIGFNSCFHNDHLNRAGSINPRCIGKVGLKLRDLNKEGRLILAAWHHNTKGGPYDQDYMDNACIQNFIVDNVKIGFHGHQHRVEVLRAENNIIDSKMMLILSAGSLCAGPKELPAGYNQQYNLLELSRTDNETIQLKVYSRTKTLQSSFENPIWERGTFNSTVSEFTTSIKHNKPPIPNLGKVEKLIGDKDYQAAQKILIEHDISDPFVRILLLECYNHFENYPGIIEHFSKPQTIPEAIELMNASLEIGDSDIIKKIFEIDFIVNTTDPSVVYLRNQLKGKIR
ncbi:MAG: metallophosphoesterase [Arcobacteraceae bacterium]|jgi:UDP-2,3-diacylglucosamine pyrophosphatase LpxH|nr:metallophosphoesterase [Arcobacteraceae bacterium]